jgi:hypothetical protein
LICTWSRLIDRKVILRARARCFLVAPNGRRGRPEVELPRVPKPL